jgi:hypothetical protein
LDRVVKEPAAKYEQGYHHPHVMWFEQVDPWIAQARAVVAVHTVAVVAVVHTAAVVVAVAHIAVVVAAEQQWEAQIRLVRVQLRFVDWYYHRSHR